MPLDLLLGAQPADDSSRSGLRIDHRLLKVDALLLPGFKPVFIPEQWNQK